MRTYAKCLAPVAMGAYGEGLAGHLLPFTGHKCLRALTP